MTEPAKNPNPFDALLDSIRVIVREEIRAALQNGGQATDTEVLLSPEKAAEMLGVSVRWIYRHASQLPFMRRLNRKNLRFSEAGLRRWVTARKLIRGVDHHQKNA